LNRESGLLNDYCYCPFRDGLGATRSGGEIYNSQNQLNVARGIPKISLVDMHGREIAMTNV